MSSRGANTPLAPGAKRTYSQYNAAALAAGMVAGTRLRLEMHIFLSALRLLSFRWGVHGSALCVACYEARGRLLSEASALLCTYVSCRQTLHARPAAARRAVRSCRVRACMSVVSMSAHTAFNLRTAAQVKQHVSRRALRRARAKHDGTLRRGWSRWRWIYTCHASLQR